jgi:maltose alpha-D-glucosyltransferase/alpha-amylase
MTRQLTKLHFSGAPDLFGEIRRLDIDGTETTIATALEFVLNQGNGWDWTLHALERLLDDQTNQAGSALPEGALASYAVFADALGRRVAEMHDALASASDEDSFLPQQATDDSLSEWRLATEQQVETALAALERTGAAEAFTALKALLSDRAAFDRQLAALTEGGIGTPITRIHGDLHLGQTLVVAGDAMIIDFEGEPAKPLTERRHKNSPLRDVAGLVRSFDYAVTSVALNRPARDRGTEESTAAILEEFRRVSSTRFLESYALHRGRPLSAGEKRLLDLFLIEKAAYEVAYEAANRPKWVNIPLRGLMGLLQQAAPAAQVVDA